jgi:hypothetical protein
MKFPKLCLPSKIYLVLSVFSVILALLLSLENILMCVLDILFALFWTWILNLMCKTGNSTIAWILVLFPVFVFLAIIFYYSFMALKFKTQIKMQEQQQQQPQQK